MLIFLILLAIVIIASIVVIKDRKDLKKRRSFVKRYEYKTIYLKDTENENKFYKTLKGDLDENPEYDLSTSELRQGYIGEKVFRYYPYNLDMKIEGNEVYGCLNGEWLRVGTLKRGTKELAQEGTLALYPMIYKMVFDDEIKKVSGDPYFAIEVKKEIV